MKERKILAIGIIFILLLKVATTTVFSISNIINNNQGVDEVHSLEKQENLYNSLKENTVGNIINQDEKIDNMKENDKIDKETINNIENSQINNYGEINKTENNQINSKEEAEEDIEKNSFDSEKEDKNQQLQGIKIEDEIETPLSQDISFSAYINVNGYKIETYLSKGIYYLFLPKIVDIKALEIMYQYGTDIKQISSGTIDIANKKIINDFSLNDNLKITTSDNKNYTIKVMQSDLPSLCINLKNDVSLKTVHAGTKDVKYPATMQIVGAKDDSYNILDDTIEFKGRGNSTWKMDKRGYQIKLNKKQNLLGIGNGKSKKWVLIANQADRTLLRNKIAYDLGIEASLTNIPNSTFIDLYVNGEFIGNYLLCDKVESGSSRVDLKDEKSVLVEIDNEYGKQEDFYFTTQKSQTTFALKSSYADDKDLGDEAQKVALESFESSINKFETLLSTKASWEEIKKVIDVESFAKLYLVMELTEDPDGFYSSTFFYKDGDKDLIHAGPVWDFDAAFGYYKSAHKGGDVNADYILNYKTNTWYTQLFQYNQFVDLVNSTYTKQLKTKFHNIINKINSNTKNMSKSIKMNFVKWNNLLGNTCENPSTTPNGNTYEAELNYLKDWITKRVNYMDNRYNIATVQYKGHIQDYGWESLKKDGETVGTVGKSKRIEAIRLILPTDKPNVHIKYKAHVQDIGWQSWVQDGQIAGTEGKSKRIEGIKIKLEGLPNYSVMYRVHIQNIGWQAWKYNGEVAGTEGQCLRIEAIEVRVVRTDYLGEAKPSSISKITYSSHIQNIGWSGWGKDGEVIGTQDRSFRLEGIKISVNNSVIPNTDVSYKVHVQDYGWQTWRSDGAFAGTEGEGKRLEGIRIKLSNPNYSVRYRTYIQNKGWSPWVADGEVAGTEGQSLRLEAIQIELVER